MIELYINDIKKKKRACKYYGNAKGSKFNHFGVLFVYHFGTL
jgi:hypothetical protein